VFSAVSSPNFWKLPNKIIYHQESSPIKQLDGTSAFGIKVNFFRISYFCWRKIDAISNHVVKTFFAIIVFGCPFFTGIMFETKEYTLNSC